MRKQALRAAGLFLFASILAVVTSAAPACAQRLRPPERAAHSQWSESAIFAFNGANGAMPTGSVIADSSGTLYGAAGGGITDHGVAFALTRGRSAWTETILHAFTGYDGDGPVGNLLAGPRGTFFGATSSGGPGCHGVFCLGGTVYELTPPAPGQQDWTTTVIHGFSSTDPAGASPAGSLIADRQGDLYGAAALGGAHGDGTIFELKPPPIGEIVWTVKVLHVFSLSDGDGVIPNQGLIAGRNGELYGTTQDGGNGIACIDRCGTVFSLTPPTHGDGPWTERILYSFTNRDGDGSLPFGGVVAGLDGSLYGTTYFGGWSDKGIAYRLSPSPNGNWIETPLHEFSRTNGDGVNPLGGLVAGPHGALYGTTSAGGSPPSETGGGIVFRLTPPLSGKGQWNEKVLYQFDLQVNGSPRSGVFQANSGVLYGSTIVGGDSPACNLGCGTIFALSP